ncbi:MAG TPA: hypothetical protein ENN80_10200 [Candidatus Hydrogenedentes bacterium]|nr:hypothetical protein [Candidatus Hydrogenedentota bacterium]
MGGNVYYETVGTAPSRVFIVQFENVPPYDGSGSARFEFKLLEATQSIEVHYDQLVRDIGTPEGGIGLNNDDGTDGAGYYCGTGYPTKAGDGSNDWAVRFYGGSLPVEISAFAIE